MGDPRVEAYLMSPIWCPFLGLTVNLSKPWILKKFRIENKSEKDRCHLLRESARYHDEPSDILGFLRKSLPTTYLITLVTRRSLRHKHCLSLIIDLEKFLTRWIKR